MSMLRSCFDAYYNTPYRRHCSVAPAARPQAHASAAVVNFSENCEKELMLPYLDTLITKLMTLLQHGKKLVQEGALTAMASVADCSQVGAGRIAGLLACLRGVEAFMRFCEHAMAGVAHTYQLG